MINVQYVLYSRLYDSDFKIEDIDPFLCTHAFYGFADMSNETWKIKSWDPWLDLNPDDCGELPDCCGLDAFRRFTGLTNINPNFHPMISVGEREEGIVDLFSGGDGGAGHGTFRSIDR